MKSAVLAKKLREPVMPSVLVIWGQLSEIEMDPAFLKAFPLSEEEAQSLVLEADGEPSKQTWQKIMLGVLIAYYDFDISYNPASEKTQHATRIMQDLKVVGISLSEKPIRDVLRTVAAWGQGYDFAPAKNIKLWRDRENPTRVGTKRIP